MYSMLHIPSAVTPDVSNRGWCPEESPEFSTPEDKVSVANILSSIFHLQIWQNFCVSFTITEQLRQCPVRTSCAHSEQKLALGDKSTPHSLPSTNCLHFILLP